VYPAVRRVRWQVRLQVPALDANTRVTRGTRRGSHLALREHTRARIARLFSTLYRPLSLSLSLFHSTSEPSVAERSRPTSLRFRRQSPSWGEARRGEARRQIYTSFAAKHHATTSPSQSGDTSVRRQQYAARSTLPSIAREVREREGREAARRLIETSVTIGDRPSQRERAIHRTRESSRAHARRRCARFSNAAFVTARGRAFDFSANISWLP